MNRVLFRGFLLIVAAVVFSGCPSPPFGITELEVIPLKVCSGAEVTITWETFGGDSVSLSAAPEVDPPLGSVGESDTATRPIDTTTTFTLEVVKGTKKKDRDETVAVIPPGGEDFIFSSLGTCFAGQPHWVKVLPPDEWGDNVVVNVVFNNTLGRDIIVSHDGTSIGIPAGGSTAEFGGKKLSGDWILRPAVLQLDENCPPDIVEGGTPPSLPALSIRVNAVCQ